MPETLGQTAAWTDKVQLLATVKDTDLSIFRFF